MQEGFEDATGNKNNDIPEAGVSNDQREATFDGTENTELETFIPEDTPEERVEALEESIRLTQIGRDAAVADMERWRNTNTTESSHFEYHLPEIQNRLTRSEQSISSSMLDIDLINAAPESSAQESKVIKNFIAGQIIEGKTLGLRNKLSSFDKQEYDYNSRVDRNHRAAEKLQAELTEIDQAIESGDPNAARLKLNRRDVLVEMNGVSDRYEILMREKADIDSLNEERVAIQSQIEEIKTAGVSEEELPKSIQEDPDFAACLREADSYASEDDQQFKRNIKYNPEQEAEKIFRSRFPQKSLYYERMVGNESVMSESESETENISEVQKEVTKDETLNTIKEQISSGSINHEVDYEKLTTESIIDTKYFYDVEPSRAEQRTFEYIDTDKIVGRPNADNYENGWAHEYDERGGRIGDIVDQINNPDNEDGIERIFHIEDETTDRIKLASYEGPAGPIYAVVDGTHRVAGIKASGLEKIPAEIFRTQYPYEKTSADSGEVADWQDKIDRGFITGSIEKVETEDGERSVLRVETEVLPWIRSRNQNDVFKINQIYEQQYPGALEKAGFPAETLTDKTALWAYMDGNFDQWKELQGSDEAFQGTGAELSELPKSITTAKGSVYTYLEDGRTQRYKSAEGEMKEPQNVLTFIPRIERISDWENYDMLPDWIKDNDNDQVMDILASDYIHNPKKRVVLTNESNEVIRSNADALKANKLTLQFVDVATNQTEFVLPVSSKPEIGDTTYDARYFDKDGREHVSAHIGNAITNIEY